jgi:site-specific recombinase XerC
MMPANSPDRAASSQSRSVNPAKGKVGFAEWAERWFATTADLEPGTRRTYRMLLDNQVLPHFGTATLAGIDTLAVREWVAGLVEGGLSPSRIRIAHQVLSQALAAGVEGGRLARNPAAGVRLPKRVEREMLFLDAAQVEQLVDAIGPHYRTLRRRACSSARAPGSRRRRRPSATAPR